MNYHIRFILVKINWSNLYISFVLQNHLSKFVCEDMLYTIEKIIEAEQNGLVQNTTYSIWEDPADCLYENRKRA